MAGSIGGRKETAAAPPQGGASERERGLLADEGKEGRKRAVKEGLASDGGMTFKWERGKKGRKGRGRRGFLRSTKCNCAKGLP